MRTTSILLVLSLVLLVGCSKDQSEEIARLKQENAELKALVSPPPTSLDSLYPPKAPAPILQIKMLEMATPFTGIVAKILEGDRKGAKALFDSFREQYGAVSELVPEWKKAYPPGPLEELAAQVEQGEQGKVMEAVEKVGKICHECHVTNMPKVQQKYHWEDFSVVSLSDPVTNRSLEFSQFMRFLDMSLVGIGMEVQQGQMEKARKHFENFKSSFSQLKETCQACHDTERKHYVDSQVDALIRKLETAVRTSSPNMKLVSEVSQQIGNESCGKCHLVHVPAAYAKARWKEWEQSPK